MLYLYDQALLKGKKAAKKSKAGRAGDFSADLDDPELQAEADLDQAPAAAPKRKGKKHHKGSKAAHDFAALDDDDEDMAPVVPDTADNADDIVEAVPVSTGKKGKQQKAGSSASAFAALGVDDDPEAVDESEDAPVTKTKSKKGKKKTTDVSSAFAALDIEGDDAEANGDFNEAEAEADAPAKSKPKSGKKKQSDATAAFAALGLDENDESIAPGPSADDVAAPEDTGAAKSARKGKKSKKTAVDTASAFAALGLEDDDAADGGEVGVVAQPDEDGAFAGQFLPVGTKFVPTNLHCLQHCLHATFLQCCGVSFNCMTALAFTALWPVVLPDCQACCINRSYGEAAMTFLQDSLRSAHLLLYFELIHVGALCL